MPAFLHNPKDKVAKTYRYEERHHKETQQNSACPAYEFYDEGVDIGAMVAAPVYHRMRAHCHESDKDRNSDKCHKAFDCEIKGLEARFANKKFEAYGCKPEYYHERTQPEAFVNKEFGEACPTLPAGVVHCAGISHGIGVDEALVLNATGEI